MLLRSSTRTASTLHLREQSYLITTPSLTEAMGRYHNSGLSCSGRRTRRCIRLDPTVSGACLRQLPRHEAVAKQERSDQAVGATQLESEH